MKQSKFYIVGILFLLLLSGCQGKIDENMSEELPDFEFTNQDGEDFGLKELKGQWWIASFMYTNCKTICPIMTGNMAILQQKLKNNNLDIHMVSFSIDPDYDSPEVLTEYAKGYQVDFSNWDFLTGYDFKTIQDLSMDSFKTAIESTSPGTGNDQIAHGTNFFLVNPEGIVIKKYDSVGKTGIEEAVNDIDTIQ
ncbi:MAG TPA: SCO family protein [Candidatus Avamphibacillus sp.]|nr:SCO family protein [Candidatus Avamphibacillus sp.]